MIVTLGNGYRNAIPANRVPMGALGFGKVTRGGAAFAATKHNAQVGADSVTRTYSCCLGNPRHMSALYAAR